MRGKRDIDLQNRFSPLTLILILILISVYRFLVLYFSDIDLYFDEAYYWGWAQSFEWGYYSKPPMIAWLLMLTTGVFGESEIAIKIGSLFVYPLTTFFVYLTAKRLFDKKVAFFSALAFFTLPAVSLSSMIISTDVVLLLFWAAGLYFFIRAIHEEKLFWWIAAGAAGGLGLLSKYTMIIFVISALLYLAISSEHRRHLKNPGFYLAMGLAALIFSPNLWWNYQNHFASFSHTAEISQLDRGLFHFGKMAEFLMAQFLVFGPFFFSILIFLAISGKWRTPSTQHSTLNTQYSTYKILLAFTFPFLAIITLQSFLARAFANWAAPAYVAATIFVVAYLIHTQKTALLRFGIGINITLAFLFYHYHTFAGLFGIEIKAKYDPYSKVRGWEELGKEVSRVLASYPDSTLLCEDRKSMAELIYYVRPHPFDAVMWNRARRLQNHYHLTTTMDDKIGQNFILVTQRNDISDISLSFEISKKIKEINIPLYSDYNLTYHLFKLENFRGY